LKDDSEIPDLLPRGRARPEPARPSREATPSPAPAKVADEPPDPNDLEFDLARERGDELPWDSPFRAPDGSPSPPEPSPAPNVAVARASAPPPELAVRSPAAGASVRPTGGASVRPAAGPSVHPSASAGPAPGPSVRPGPPTLDLGLESTVWDLDDELGDPRAAQLNVAVPMPAKDDVPWPVGRSPHPEDLDIADGEVDRALGLPSAPGWLSSPLYFWAARRALGRLASEIEQAAAQLEEMEGARDRLLGELARAARPKLEATDRFRAPYDRVDDHARVADDAKVALGRADTQSETGLAEVDVELESARATVALRTRDAAERRALAQGGQRDLARLRAALQRHVIERRNVVSRAQETSAPGSEMPPELAGRFLAVEEQIKRAEAEVAAVEGGQKQLDLHLRAAEDEERQAVAHLRRIEAKREGLVLAQQGTLGDLNEILETSEKNLERALAEVGLAIVELRGEVPIDEGIRRQLLGFDAEVATRSVELERLRRATSGVDRDGYARGRAVLIGVALALVLALAWRALA